MSSLTYHKICEWNKCKKEFIAKSSKARFCSDKCRNSHNYWQKNKPSETKVIKASHGLSIPSSKEIKLKKERLIFKGYPDGLDRYDFIHEYGGVIKHSEIYKKTLRIACSWCWVTNKWGVNTPPEGYFSAGGMVQHDQIDPDDDITAKEIICDYLEEGIITLKDLGITNAE